MRTAEELLRFAVAFTRVPLRSLPDAQVVTLRRGIADFLEGDRERRVLRGLVVAPAPYVGSPLDDLTVDELVALQAQVEAMLRPAAAHSHLFETLLGLGAPPARIPIQHVVLTVVPYGEACGYVLNQVTVHDAVLLVLWDTLRHVRHGHLRVCPEAACGHRIFLRLGRGGRPTRRLYCSRACADRVMHRREDVRHRAEQQTTQKKTRMQQRRTREYLRRKARRPS